MLFRLERSRHAFAEAWAQIMLSTGRGSQGIDLMMMEQESKTFEVGRESGWPKRMARMIAEPPREPNQRTPERYGYVTNWKTRKMPVNVAKTPNDEVAWERAKVRK